MVYFPFSNQWYTLFILKIQKYKSPDLHLKMAYWPLVCQNIFVEPLGRWGEHRDTCTSTCVYIQWMFGSVSSSSSFVHYKHTLLSFEFEPEHNHLCKINCFQVLHPLVLPAPPLPPIFPFLVSRRFYVNSTILP